MIAVLCLLGLGDAAWLTHFIATHRTGLSTALLAFTATRWHRIRRLIINPGRRVAGRDTPRPREAAA